MNTNGTFGFTGFDQVDAYYEASSSFAGGVVAGFSALLALEVRKLWAAPVTLFGNTDNSALGWDFRRDADVSGALGTVGFSRTEHRGPVTCAYRNFTQSGGTLSSVCSSAGNGFNVTGRSSVIFSGGANTTITGLGAATVGIAVTGGSHAWFNGSLANVSDPTTGDGANVGGTVYTNATVQSRAVDQYLPDGAGAGNTLGRAA